MTTATDTKARIEAASRATAAKIASMLWHAHDFEVDTKWLTAEIQAAMREQVEALSSPVSSETPEMRAFGERVNRAFGDLFHVKFALARHPEHVSPANGKWTCACDICHPFRLAYETLDIALRKSVLGEGAVASSETQQDRPSQRPEKTADDAPVEIFCVDTREAWAMGFNAAMAEVYPSAETQEERPASEAKKDEIAKRLDELLAIRVGDDLCDDCGGSLLAASSSDFGVLEPCSDCVPQPPLLLHVERDFIERVKQALSDYEAQFSQYRTRRRNDA